MALILLDYDGVLADTIDDLLQFGQEACDGLGINHVVTKDDLNNLEYMSFATYARACDVPESLVSEFVQYCIKRFSEKESPPAIFNGLGHIVRQLAVNHTLVIVTTNYLQNVTAFLVEHNLDGYMGGVFSNDLPGLKVQKIFLAQEQFSSDTKHKPVIMVGDSLSDIQAAKEASVMSIAVTWGHQSLNHLLRGNPDYVVHSPQELLEVIERIG
jgi:phosphoglycolate phosphatase